MFQSSNVRLSSAVVVSLRLWTRLCLVRCVGAGRIMVRTNEKVTDKDHQPATGREVKESPRHVVADYEEAIRNLNSLQSNASVVELAKKRPVETALQSIPKTVKYLARVGIAVDDLDKLKVIHVSGTKGKGSTCAFCECILRKHGLRTGFYSSPHMVAVRERIAINGKPLSESAFADYFWDVYNQLLSNTDNPDDMPAYFKFLTVMAFHVFLKEKIDVAIVEVGIGGLYDCTNVIRNPVVCGVTSLGLDHINLLGSSLDRIAFQKAGIFKPGVPAITVPQKENAMKVLQDQATRIGVPLLTAPTLDSHQWNGRTISLGLAGAMQQENAALAVQLVATWLQRRNQSPDNILFANATCDSQLPEAPTYEITSQISDGLRDCNWPGRHQILQRGKLVCFLDGAHTLESMKCCADWFQQVSFGNRFSSSDKIGRVLMFNSTGDRTPYSLLNALLPCKFDVAIFCPNTVYVSSCASSDQLKVTDSRQDTWDRCKLNRKVWEELTIDRKSCTAYFDCISNVLSFLHSSLTNDSVSDKTVGGGEGDNDSFLPVLTRLAECSQIHVLVTGSLHLVGGVLSIIDPNLESREPEISTFRRH